MGEWRDGTSQVEKPIIATVFKVTANFRRLLNKSQELSIIPAKIQTLANQGLCRLKVAHHDFPNVLTKRKNYTTRRDKVGMKGCSLREPGYGTWGRCLKETYTAYL